MLSMVTFFSFIKDIACINDAPKLILLIIVDYDFIITGNKLEGEWGEIVALGAEISP